MNMREARELAKKKWGVLASVRKDRYKRPRPFWVGKFNSNMEFVRYGLGNSWEDAFKDAAKKGF